MSDEAVVRLAAATSGFTLWASVIATLFPALFFIYYRDRSPTWLRRVVFTPVVLLVVYHILYAEYDYSKRFALGSAWIAAAVFVFPMTIIERVVGSVVLSAVFAATAFFPVAYAIARVAVESASVSTLIIVAGGVTLLAVAVSIAGKEARALFNTLWILESACLAVLVVNGINVVLVGGGANDPEEILQMPDTLTARAIVISGVCTAGAARSVVCFMHK